MGQAVSKVDLPIEAYVEPGERLLWQGRPATGIRFQIIDLLAVPLSLIWFGGALYWENIIVTNVLPQQPLLALLPILFGGYFVLSGLYFFLGRFFDNALIRRTAEYAVTNRRIMILKGRFSRSLRVIPLKTLDATTLTVHRNGIGTIHFGRRAPRIVLPTFDFVHEAKAVHRLIENAR